VEDRAAAGAVLDVVDGDEALVDWFQQVLVYGHFGACEVRLLCLGGDEQESALFLEALDDFGGLFCYQPAEALAKRRKLANGRFDEGIKLLDRLG
jgi:hypothetical protein